MSLLKPRVLYLLNNFPQMSQTYIRSEIEAVSNEFDVRVIAFRKSDIEYRRHVPYTRTDEVEDIQRIIEDFRPDVLHTHWLLEVRSVAYMAGLFGNDSPLNNIPFTIRSHSFDVLGHNGQFISEAAPVINHDLCLGVLAFPFCRPLLEAGGVQPEKIHDCFPVVHFERFYDPSPNGNGVMNVGAALAKKGMHEFVELASRSRNRRFDLYALGFLAPELNRLNAKVGSPVHMMPPVEPDEMPAEYKKHSWLVYTGDRSSKICGWPMAIAEAQAAGVGVCMPNIRPDLKDYIGGAGYLYDNIDEVAEIISKPYPDELRLKGFEQARKSNIFEHKRILTDLWLEAVSSPARKHSRTSTHNGALAEWGACESSLERRYRLNRVRKELRKFIAPEDKFILLSGGLALRDPDLERRALPFLERDGQPWGVPQDDAQAISELDRMRRNGASTMVLLWPDFWWLKYYGKFHDHLQSSFKCLLNDDNAIVFDLQDPRRPSL